VWIFLAARLILPVDVANVESAFSRLLQTEKQNSLEDKEKSTDGSSGNDAVQGRVIFEIPAQMATPIMAQSANGSKGVTPLGLAAFIWISGSIAVITVHLASYLYYRRQVIKKGTDIKDNNILEQIRGLERELYIKHSVSAVIFSGASSPMVTGIFKPVLILPDEQYSQEQMYFILKHELVHLKRRDIYIKLLFVAANAIHWFNPFVWIMQKEAVVDMELSCDERVTQGAGFDIRKAYAETLLSAIHKQCEKKNILFARFYGEKQIMKKRFRNILIKTKKKYGISVLVCAIILTAGIGSQTGCLAVKRDTAIKKESVPAGKNMPENTMVLEFSKEGETEQKQALLTTGDGYGIYLPDGEWKQSGSGRWTAAVNENVKLWVKHFKGRRSNIEKKLVKNGYKTSKKYGLLKKQNGIIYKCKLYKLEKNIWGVFYSYPAEAEEGWGMELPVIADTFTAIM
ncbi:MAG: M56 family metallopeptidase, partial [Lachnospiraceae bacterium]|nr:M56 family metallopeptidase [Lachnospiraceae bacterium]